LDGAARDALLIHGYRTGRVGLSLVAKALGLATTFEAHRWLADRGVPLNYDLEELDADRETLRHSPNVEV
jgi:predicted HTH domain antitoxin